MITLITAVVELLTGEKVRCTGCERMMESEKMYIPIDVDSESKEVEVLALESFCQACYEER